MNRRIFIATTAAAALTCALPSWASGYPNQPLRMLVPYAPGGGIDNVARYVANGMSQILGQSIVVQNRPGAGGVIGAQAAVQSTPDGYTILLAGNPELTINPHLMNPAPYSVQNDLAPNMVEAQSPNVFVIQSSTAAKTLPELLEQARKSGKGFTVGTPGTGSPQHLAIEAMKSITGLPIVHVPYKGAAPAVTALLGGEIDAALVGAPPARPHMESGKLLALAVTQKQRSPLFPDIPTMQESAGLMNEDYLTWYGLLAPAGTPQEALDRLYKALSDVLQTPETKQKMAAWGTDVLALDLNASAQRIQDESNRYAALIKQFNIRRD